MAVCETCTAKAGCPSTRPTPVSALVRPDSKATTFTPSDPPPFPSHTTEERSKAVPWRPPGSPGSASVVATSVAAAVVASAAVARPAINVRRKRTSGGSPRQSSTGRRTGRRTGSPDQDFFRGGGDENGDDGGPGHGHGYGYGEEEFPRSAGGAYEEWLAETRYRTPALFGSLMVTGCRCGSPVITS